MPVGDQRVRWTPPTAPSRRAHLQVRVVGDGRPIVCLHGLAGSGRYFGAEYEALRDIGRVVFVDLLGFGRSPRPKIAYTPDEHVAAISETLDALGIDEPAVLVGHSTGTLIALRMATVEPERVAGVVAFSPPIYRTSRDARKRVGASSFMTRLFVMKGPLPRLMCRLMCRYRASASGVAAKLRPDLPELIARDGVEHTWSSYSGTLERVVISADALDWVDGVNTDVRLIAGGLDDNLDRALLRELARDHQRVSLAEWPHAAHDTPLTHVDECLVEIRSFVDGLASRSKNSAPLLPPSQAALRR